MLPTPEQIKEIATGHAEMLLRDRRFNPNNEHHASSPGGVLLIATLVSAIEEAIADINLDDKQLDTEN